MTTMIKPNPIAHPVPSLDEIRALHALPFSELLFRAHTVHRAHHDTGLSVDPLMETDAVLEAARAAKAGGALRFCMGAAWREVKDGAQFNSVLETVRGVSSMGLEVCCTLGMVKEEQARRLKDAGCAVYNHNLDTSREFYPSIIGTRTYDDRLDTLAAVRRAGLQVCSGGIMGLGETVEDRLKLLRELASLDPQPESVPINALVPVPGTPLGDTPPVDPLEFVRVIALARILLPNTMVRLSAGRTAMSDELQAMCFFAGANSIFLGEKLLTTANPGRHQDFELLRRLGMHPLGRDFPADAADAVEAETAGAGCGCH